MPKVVFDNKSYIEITKSATPGKVVITIAARDNDKKLAVIANSVELTEEQFAELIKLV